MIRSPSDWLSSGRLCSRFDDLLSGHPLYTRTSKPAFLRRVTPATKTDNFLLRLYVKHFRPEQIVVKTVDNFVVIHAKHEDQADHHGFVSREFTRRYELPDNVDPKMVTASISEEGILTISAPLKKLNPPAENERIVPITIQALETLGEKGS